MSEMRHLTRLRWGVRGVLTLGVAASVAANVLHAPPHPISQAIAAWPPIALLLTVELVSRVPVHRRGLAAARIAATITIASIAAWVSYWHMTGVAARFGERGASPYLLPLSVDGLIVVASICLVELAGRIAAYQPAATLASSSPHDLTEPPDPQAQHPRPAVDAHRPVYTDSPTPQAVLDVVNSGQHEERTGPLGGGPLGHRPLGGQVEPAPVERRTGTTAAAVQQRPASTRASAEPESGLPYQPMNDEDAAMYEVWQRGLAAGREPSGVDLARAAGRPNDASGIGRKAARRYRDAHAEAQAATFATRFTGADTSSEAHNGAATPRHRNGHRPDGAAA